MIVDLILDRYDGCEYKAKKFYDDVMAYEEGTDYKISRALDGGTEEDVKRELCDYIIRNNYNPKICNYINKVTWLKDDKIDYDDLRKWFNELANDFEDFIISDNINEITTSDKYARQELIIAFGKFLDNAEFFLKQLKDLDKELKL